jgi:hypothetical protein
MSDDLNTGRHYHDAGPLTKNVLAIREHVRHRAETGAPADAEWLAHLADALSALAEKVEALENTQASAAARRAWNGQITVINGGIR